MSLTKHSDTEWELHRTLDNGSSSSEQLTATVEGLEVGWQTLIPWSDLDHAREIVYKQAQTLDMTKSREEFEAQIRKFNPKYPLIFHKWVDGSYCQHEVQHMWKGWQLALSVFGS